MSVCPSFAAWGLLTSPSIHSPALTEQQLHMRHCANVEDQDELTQAQPSRNSKSGGGYIQWSARSPGEVQGATGDASEKHLS